MIKKAQRSPITFRVSEEQENHLRSLARQKKISMSKVIKVSLFGSTNDEKSAA